jgi:carbonic anhydrase
MDGPRDLIHGYQRFRSNTYANQVTDYRELGMGAQHPAILIIACADSRADPSAIFDAGPGQLFVIRNVANLVPPYEKNDGLKGYHHGVSAALEYAVTVLKVRHVVVMGHGGCGGISASLSSDRGDAPDASMGFFIGPWVSMLSACRDKVLDSGSFNPQYALELEGIEMSLENLRTFSFVEQAVQAGSLELHGAW